MILDNSLFSRISAPMSCSPVLESIVEVAVMLSCVHITEMKALLGAGETTQTFQLWCVVWAPTEIHPIVTCNIPLIAAAELSNISS